MKTQIKIILVIALALVLIFSYFSIRLYFSGNTNIHVNVSPSQTSIKQGNSLDFYINSSYSGPLSPELNASSFLSGLRMIYLGNDATNLNPVFSFVGIIHYKIDKSNSNAIATWNSTVLCFQSSTLRNGFHTAPAGFYKINEGHYTFVGRSGGSTFVNFSISSSIIQVMGLTANFTTNSSLITVEGTSLPYLNNITYNLTIYNSGLTSGNNTYSFNETHTYVQYDIKILTNSRSFIKIDLKSLYANVVFVFLGVEATNASAS